MIPEEGEVREAASAEKEEPAELAPAAEAKVPQQREPLQEQTDSTPIPRPIPSVPQVKKEMPVPAALRNAVRPVVGSRQPVKAPVRDPEYMKRVPLGQSGPEVEAARQAAPIYGNQPRPAVQGRQTIQRPTPLPNAGTPRAARQNVQPEEEEDLYQP